MNEARRHAVTASEYLNSLDAISDRLKNDSPEDHLMRVATGQVHRLNRDMEWTARCAMTHAVVAIALSMTLDEDALDKAIRVSSPSRAETDPETEPDPNATYEVVKFYRDPDKPAEVVEDGVTLDRARELCNDPATSNIDEGWFYGFRKEGP